MVYKHYILLGCAALTAALISANSAKIRAIDENDIAEEVRYSDLKPAEFLRQLRNEFVAERLQPNEVFYILVTQAHFDTLITHCYTPPFGNHPAQPQESELSLEKDLQMEILTANSQGDIWS